MLGPAWATLAPRTNPKTAIAMVKTCKGTALISEALDYCLCIGRLELPGRLRNSNSGSPVANGHRYYLFLIAASNGAIASLKLHDPVESVWADAGLKIARGHARFQ